MDLIPALPKHISPCVRENTAQTQQSCFAQPHHEPSVPQLRLHAATALVTAWTRGLFLQTNDIITSSERRCVVSMTVSWLVDPHNWNHLDF